MPKKKKLSALPLREVQRLVAIVHRLRRECPWDRKQTHKSLIKYLVEETYEAVEAIESRDLNAMREELGDVLLQVVLHAEIADQKGKFSLEDVARTIADKMERRHPHIFGDAKIKSAKAQTRSWSKLKAKEKPERSLLAGTPKAMPALQLAQRYGEIAASVNFDWGSAKEVMTKVDEELGELKVEMDRPRKRRDDLEMELGDFLFTITRLAAHLGLDAERALKKSASKFESRFGALELEFRKKEQSLEKASLEEMEAVWTAIKKSEPKSLPSK